MFFITFSSFADKYHLNNFEYMKKKWKDCKEIFKYLHFIFAFPDFSNNHYPSGSQMLHLNMCIRM